MVSQSKIDNLNIPLDEDIFRRLGRLAEDAGYRIYLVGGYVRDHFLKRPNTDIDCSVIGDSIDFAKRAAERFNSKAVLYEKFRTALVPVGEYKIEFVGTRKEEYLPDSRKPIVTVGTLEDDLRRRDFTVNAMAVSLNEDNFGEVIDLFGGLRDLDAKLLRTPLDPVETYSDDPLRMMRAARFAAQLGFTVDPPSFDAIGRMAERIKIVSQERVTDEMLKILESPNPAHGFRILHASGLLKYIFPELEELAGVDIVQEDSKTFGHKDVFNHTLQVLENVAGRSDNLWLRFAALVHDIAKPRTKKYVPGTGWTFHGHEELGARYMKKLFRKMKLPMEHLPYVEKLVRLHQRPMALVDEGVTDSAVRRLAVAADDALDDLFLLCRSDITTGNPRLTEQYMNNYEIVWHKVLEVQEKDRLRAFQSPVRGDEIMEVLGIEPSRIVGAIKSEIEEAILDGVIPNEYDPAREYFMSHKDEWLEKYRMEFKNFRKNRN